MADPTFEARVLTFPSDTRTDALLVVVNDPTEPELVTVRWQAFDVTRSTLRCSQHGSQVCAHIAAAWMPVIRHLLGDDLVTELARQWPELVR